MLCVCLYDKFQFLNQLKSELPLSPFIFPRVGAISHFALLYVAGMKHHLEAKMNANAEL